MMNACLFVLIIFLWSDEAPAVYVGLTCTETILSGVSEFSCEWEEGDFELRQNFEGPCATVRMTTDQTQSVDESECFIDLQFVCEKSETH